MQKLELEGLGAPVDKLLLPNPRRFVLFPIKYPKVWLFRAKIRCRVVNNAFYVSTLLPQVWDMYKKAVASHWTAEEIDLAHDRKVGRSQPMWDRHMCYQIVTHLHRTGTS